MTTIYLKYGTWSGGTLTWVTNAESFNCLKFIPKVNTKRISGRDLREVEYNHLLSSRVTWEVVIGADELYTTAKYAFLQNFWKAHAWKFAVTGSNYISFENGKTEPLPGDIVTGASSGKQGHVSRVIKTDGAWGDNDAEGNIFLYDMEAPFTEGESLNMRGSQTVSGFANATTNLGNPSLSNEIEVELVKDGDLPVDFVKDNKLFPKVTLTMVQKNPD